MSTTITRGMDWRALASYMGDATQADAEDMLGRLVAAGYEGRAVSDVPEAAWDEILAAVAVR